MVILNDGSFGIATEILTAVTTKLHFDLQETFLLLQSLRPELLGSKRRWSSGRSWGLTGNKGAGHLNTGFPRVFYHLITNLSQKFLSALKGGALR